MYILYRDAYLILEVCATPFEAQEARKKYHKKPRVRVARDYQAPSDESVDRWLEFKNSIPGHPLYIAPLSVIAFRKRNPRKDIP